MPPRVATRRPARSASVRNARRVGVADAQHLAEFVVRNRRGERSAARRRVFDAAQADVGVAPRDRLIDRGEGPRTNRGVRFRPRAMRSAISTSNPTRVFGSRGSLRQMARPLRDRRPISDHAARHRRAGPAGLGRRRGRERAAASNADTIGMRTRERKRRSRYQNCRNVRFKRPSQAKRRMGPCREEFGSRRDI